MTLPDRFDLSEVLSLQLPHLTDSLSTPRARSSLLRLAKHLPPFPRVLFECRLAEAAQVDLSIGITDSEVDRGLLPKYFTSDGSERWDRFCSFVDWWCEENLSESDTKSAWFEFDLDSETDALSLPSVFLHLKASPVQPCTAESTGAARALEQLKPGSVEPLDRWLQTLPPEAKPNYVGVMLSRPQSALRLNIAGLTSESAWDWIARHGTVRPECRSLFEKAYDLGGSTVLAVDIDDAVGSRIGLECRPENESASQAIFDILSARNLCTDNAYQSLCNWPGKLSILENGVNWPLHLVIEAMLRKNSGISVLLRRINHVKLVFEEGELTDAKIYLAFEHVVHSGESAQSCDA